MAEKTEKIEEQETRVKSFRITDDTAEKFKEIAATIGGNQQETLAKLIENYEMQAGKAAFTDTRAEIEQFEGYTIALNRMFMTAIENQQNTKNIVRAEFDAQLKSKDAIIIELQKQAEELTDKAKLALAQSKEDAETAKKIRQEAISEKERLELTIKSLEDKLHTNEQLNAAVTDSLNSLKAKNGELEEECSLLRQSESEYKNKNSELSIKNEEAKKKLDNVIHDNEMLKMQLENQRKSAQLDTQKAVMDAWREADSRLAASNKEFEDRLVVMQDKVNDYQNRYVETVEKVQSLIAKADSGVDEGIELVKAVISDFIKNGKVNELDKITTMSRNEIYSYKKN